MKIVKTVKLVSFLLIAGLLSGCCGGSCASSCSGGNEPNISVFASFIRKTSKERGVTLAEAADMLYALGVRGFDVGPRDKDLPELAATKLKPINFYFFPNMFAPDNGAADCRFCLDKAVEFGVPRVMVVPSNFTKGGNEEEEFAKVLSSMKMFVEEGRKRGITITVEDFGGTANPGSHAKYLKRLLDEIPGLCFALDSGNMYYAGRGESILDMMEYAKGRIAHVHLKDQKPDDNRKYETLGLGAVPNAQIVKAVAAAGYTGWYTLENPVGDTYADTVRQVAVLKYWLSAPAQKHECCCSPCACEGRCSCIGGRWAFPMNGRGGWMGVVKNPDGSWSSSILWGGGSPIRQASAVYENGVLTMRQKHGAGTRETLAKAEGDKIKLTLRVLDKDGKLKQEKLVEGWRIPAVPPPPDLSAIKYGEPIDLLAGGLVGWMAMGAPSQHNGWSFKDGVLSNRIARKPDGKPIYGSANLQTKRADFEDFRISYDVRVLPECNSGVYLRGIYELQVLDSYGKPRDCHNMAAFYGRITPSVSAEKPANEWQHVDAILCDRHVTVELNGVKIIDNQPVLGVTGGAMTPDEFVPGPIYLQGDHSDADFRKMVLTPILKKLR